MLKKAYSVFNKLDKNKNNQINSSDIKNHFGTYSTASAQILMREIDLDKDGNIGFN